MVEIMDIATLYHEQVNPKVEMYRDEGGKEKKQYTCTRASKDVRYTHFRKPPLTLEGKERESLSLIKMGLQRVTKPVVSCSFGVDSVVTVYLTLKALRELGKTTEEIEIVWNDTKNEFKEVRDYARDLTKLWGLHVIVTSPKKMLKTVIEENGGVTSDYFFTRKGDRRKGRPLSEKCCGTLKHEPMKRAIKEYTWDLVINGLRADESRQRMQAGLRDGEFFYSIAEWKAFVCRPILWWKEEEIWEYVEQEKIPVNTLYEHNLIQKYPKYLDAVVEKYRESLLQYNISIEDLLHEQIQTVNRKQAILLQKIGFTLFTPRTGCQMCPIPVKYGYLQWMRLYYPKVYAGMIYNLGYGKVLLDMIPDDVREELEETLGISLSEENAHEHLRDILQYKPCTFDKFI